MENVGAGFFFNLLAANIYILPLFSFIGQIVSPDRSTEQLQTHMRHQLFAGPGNRLPPDFLLSLTSLGFPANLRDLETSILASQIRLALTTKLKLQHIASETSKQILSFYNHHGTQHPHVAWHDLCFVKTLWMQHTKFQELGGE